MTSGPFIALEFMVATMARTSTTTFSLMPKASSNGPVLIGRASTTVLQTIKGYKA
jgi:hypothetical protein